MDLNFDLQQIENAFSAGNRVLTSTLWWLPALPINVGSWRYGVVSGKSELWVNTE